MAKRERKESNIVTRSIALSEKLIRVIEFFKEKEESSFAHIIRKCVWLGLENLASKLSADEQKELEELLEREEIRKIKIKNNYEKLEDLRKIIIKK